MSIIFEPFYSDAGSFPLKRRPRLRMADAPTVFVLQRTAHVSMTGTATRHATMSLRRRHTLRMNGIGATTFLLYRQPILALAGVDVPLAPSVFFLNRPGHAVAMTAHVTKHVDMALVRQPRLLMAGVSARFILRRPPSQIFMTDGQQVSGNTAFMVQQPELYATALIGASFEITDRFSARDSYAADAIQAILDLIRMSDAYSTAAEVIQSLLERFSIADVARMIWEVGLVDQFVASAVQEGTAQITVLLSDAFTATGATTSISEIIQAITDGFYVSLVLNNGDAGYTAWVMTPQTKAMRSYTDFPFNSYATVGGMFLGASDAGIYRMGGTTDEGELIRASIRTGLMNFGSESMKSNNRAYIGTTTSGALLMRVQATTVDKRRVEQTYRMIPAVVDDARALRVDIGRGFHSVYWIFEICNDEDGAAFEVHDWHLLPVTLTGSLI